MIIKEVTKADYEELLEFCKIENIQIPVFSDLITMYVVKEKSEIIAFGYLAKFVEFAAFPSHKSKKNKVKALKLLNEKVIKDAKLIPVSQIHVTTDYVGFEAILHKIGYRSCKGKFLYLNVPE